MTPEQIDIVQRTFAEVADMGESVANQFYERLFEIAPEVRSMFPDDITEQSRKLLATLRVAVIGLRDDEEVPGVLRHLGAAHRIDHDVRPEHYDLVGEALLWTLEQNLGPDWTDEVAATWSATYDKVSDTMRSGADTSV